MATPTADTLTVPAGTAVVYGGRAGGAAAPFTVRADGIWTWFTAPEAIQLGDYLYVGWVDSTGKCGATRLHIPTQAAQHFNLSAALEVDDHNNASMIALPDGRQVWFYGIHNDTAFRYRIWNGTGPFDQASSWTAEQLRGTGQGPYSYPKPLLFSGDASGKLWAFWRRWTDGGGGTRSLAYRTCAGITGSSDTWSAYTDVLIESGARPYVMARHDGVTTLHVIVSSAHPNEATYISLHHFKGVLDGSGAMTWRDSADSLIAAPFGIASTTRIDDGGNMKRWISDCGIGADGHPRALWMRYPNNNGTAIEYWHSRWTGSSWVATKLTDDGGGLYSAEQYYHGGLRFDANDCTRVYLSAPISGVRQVQEWRTADEGATWSRHRTITSGGTAGNPLRLRPVSPRGHDGRIALLWCEGSYTSFTSYLTDIKGAG